MENVSETENYAELPHILVVDDDDRIRTLVSRYLNDHGFFAFTASDAAKAKDILKMAEMDAIVLDVMMPGQSGRDMTEEIRSDNDIPVLLLTAMGETEDKISGLQAGADDYLTKPFDPQELVLRLKAILRRRPKAVTRTEKIKIGQWIYDPEMNELSDGSRALRLTDVEGTLLKALASRAGDILSRDQLAELCDLDAGERTIDVQVTRLRKKLGEDSKAPKYLQTVRGKGYLLYAEYV